MADDDRCVSCDAPITQEDREANDPDYVDGFGTYACRRCMAEAIGCVTEFLVRNVSPAPRPPGVRLDRREETVGPKEDPYARTTRTVVIPDGRKVSVVHCSFAQTTELLIDGSVEVTDTGGDELDDRFLELTGIVLSDFDDLYYGEGGEGWVDDEVVVAERAAGWDPSP